MNTDLVITALGKIGLHEAAGALDNPAIIQMAQEAGFKDYRHDDISWCSMFVNWLAKKCKYNASNALNAKSWLNVGTATVTPEMGDVTVLWRDKPDSWMGHVALFIRQDEIYVYLLGGNQGDAVSIMPYLKTRVLGFRRLEKVKP